MSVLAWAEASTQRRDRT